MTVTRLPNLHERAVLAEERVRRLANLEENELDELVSDAGEHVGFVISTTALEKIGGLLEVLAEIRAADTAPIPSAKKAETT